MEQTVEEFFLDFQQKLLAEADANDSQQLESFMSSISDELITTGFVEGDEFCHFRAQRGLRVDGCWFDDEVSLAIFVADFESRRELETLTKTEVDATFKRAINFVEAAVQGKLISQRRSTDSSIRWRIATATFVR